MTNLKKLFLAHCRVKKLEINVNQLKIIELLIKFYRECFKKTFFRNLFSKKITKKSFYLVGDVGVGKTMLLNFFYNNVDLKKKRLHFNEFMIGFHDFVHLDKTCDPIEIFVKNLKRNCELIYFDEFQITNIVDAMILGSLFEKIFKENIKIIITSNISINDLYKDGLQREQFLPFINILKNACHEHELIIEEDYRKSLDNSLERFFYPLNEESNFKINQLFRKLTKGKKVKTKKLNIKSREFVIKDYYEKIARFDFNDLCDKNIGAEDYIEISKECDFIVIENIPNFTDENSNKQQRFITLIDIVYDKKIPLMTSSIASIENFTSSKSLEQPFKRTLSRLYELTSLNLSAIK
jgi:cell division protein ZapE